MRTGRKAAAGRRCLAEGCERRVAAGRALCRGHERSGDGRAVEEAVGRLARRVGALAEATAAPAPDAETRSRGENDDGAVTGQRGKRDEKAARRRGEAAFRRGVERGEYAGLFGGRLREVMGQAAAEKGVAEELGALRVMLARLLSLEGEDPLRLAHGVARLADVALRAARAQRALAGEDGDEVTRTFLKVLAEMDAEEAAKGGRLGPGAGWDDEDDGWTPGGAGPIEDDSPMMRERRDARVWEAGA